MRVTSSMYYDSIYGKNNSKITRELFDVNKQIASGLSIEYASDDVRTFSETMRLDNEVATLGQIKKSTENGAKVANQSDVVLNDFTNTLDRTKTLLVQAANDTNSATSLDAIAAELRGLENHFKTLANTSVNGKYLFSGSAVDTKPIADDGTYQGNDKALNAFVGNQNQLQFNVSGAELFLGEESSRKKEVVTNVINYNTQEPDKIITAESTIRELVGYNEAIEPNDAVSHFYVRGHKSNGESINERIDLGSESTVNDLLKGIEKVYGENTVNVSLNSKGEIVVQDKMSGSSRLDFFMVGATDFNTDGNNNDDAEVNNLFDLESSKVHVKSFVDSKFSIYSNPKTTSVVDLADKDSFSMTGLLLKDRLTAPATQFTPLDEVLYSQTDTITLSGTDVNGDAVSLDFDPSGKTVNDLLAAIDNTFDNTTDATLDTYNSLSVTIEDGKIKIKSSSDTSSSNLDINMLTKDAAGDPVAGVAMDYALVYDTAQFEKKGDTLSSNVAQIRKSDNAFATPATKLSEVADLSKKNVNTLDGTTYRLVGYKIDGKPYEANINLHSSANGGSDFTVKVDTDGDGTLDTDVTYNIYNMADPREKVDADEMTYRQFMDVMNMVITDKLPASNPGTAQEYDTAVQQASLLGSTELSYDGKITFIDKTSNDTRANIILADSDGNSTLSFQANNALSVIDPKTDFFKTLDEAISAVEEHKLHPDADSGDARNVGIQNAIQMIDDLSDHVYRTHSKIGAKSNSLNNAHDRSVLLETTTISLRSSIVDTDLAEASLRLTQLNTNYQAMLSTVGKVSQLSLVNYLK